MCAFLAAALAVTTGEAGVAQTTEPARDVIVTGRRTLDLREARRFAKSIVAPVDGQLARFRQPVCPAVIGLSRDVAAAVVARLRAVIAEAGAPIAKRDCGEANAILIVSTDPAALLKDIRRTRPAWLEGVGPAAFARLADAPGPVRAWRATELQNEDGHSLRALTDTGDSGRGATGSLSLPPAPTLRVMSASILNPPTQQVIGRAFVLVEARATAGKTITQIADHAAMRLLAVTRPVGMGTPSILTLFAGASAPAEATDADLAFLKGLYGSPPALRASTQLHTIAATMAKGDR